MVTELALPAQQPQEEEPPQAQQPEVAQADQPAGGGQLLGQALQEHIAQAVRPILGELEQRIVQSVRQQMEQARQEGPQGDEQPQEGEEAVVQGTATSSKQTVQWLSSMRSALLRTMRSMVQAAVSVLRTVVQALQKALTVAVRSVMQALAPVVQQLGKILGQVVEIQRQALASVVQQLGEIMRPMLLEALHQLVQPLLQRTAERGVAAVLKTLESTLQGRKQVQPAPAGAQEAAAR